jgi:hypothetical protein
MRYMIARLLSLQKPVCSRSPWHGQAAGRMGSSRAPLAWLIDGTVGEGQIFRGAALVLAPY